MWDLYLTLDLFGLIGIAGSGYYFKENIPRLQWLSVAAVLLIMGGFYINAQVTLETVHDNEILFRRIDQLSINELRNKMKMCIVDNNNCQLGYDN